MMTNKELEERLNALQEAFIKAQQNQVAATQKADGASISIPPMNDQITSQASDISLLGDAILEMSEIIYS